MSSSKFGEVTATLHRFVRVWCDELLANEIAGALSCAEVDALASVLRAGGEPDAADLWLQAHSRKDEADDIHFGLSTPDLD